MLLLLVVSKGFINHVSVSIVVNSEEVVFCLKTVFLTDYTDYLRIPSRLPELAGAWRADSSHVSRHVYHRFVVLVLVYRFRAL